MPGKRIAIPGKISIFDNIAIRYRSPITGHFIWNMATLATCMEEISKLV